MTLDLTLQIYDKQKLSISEILQISKEKVSSAVSNEKDKILLTSRQDTPGIEIISSNTTLLADPLTSLQQQISLPPLNAGFFI